MLSRKTFATNLLKQTFVLDVWFHSQILYTKTENLSNIDEIWYRITPKKNSTADTTIMLGDTLLAVGFKRCFFR